MRRKDREITDKNRILEILQTAKILHLGLFDEGYPYVVPLHYGFTCGEEGAVTFYMHGAREGYKLDLIRKDPHVCIELECDVEEESGGDVPCAYGSFYASVIARGTAEILEDPEEKAEGLKCLMRCQTGREFEISPKMAMAVAVIRVKVDELTAKSKAKQ